MRTVFSTGIRFLIVAVAALGLATAGPAAAQTVQPLVRAPLPATIQPTLTNTQPETQKPDANFNVNFPPTPVGMTSTATCGSECFAVNDGTTNCNGSGTITIDKNLSAPFSVFNFRKTSGTGCSGTAVTMPAHLNSGERLLFDFNFSPTTTGNFSDTLILSGATWTLTGSTPSSTGCVADANTLCLNGDRFRVTATWHTPNGMSGNATMVTLTSDTGYMWFFASTNVEVVIKALNGCGVNNRFWVFAGGLTDVRVAIHVTDMATGVTNTYINPQGTPFQPLQDTGAFPCP